MVAIASFALATPAWDVLVARAVAWLGRGVRTSFGPLTALCRLAVLLGNYRVVPPSPPVLT